ncbi:hypothetical protein [Hyphomicrobium sp. DY-1]|uniref:hypothetical protein n=1 Tax=Hyphomicrobium sp. DY-1 TaxID=3075650 RepID=UPI0039C2D64D
MMMRRGRPWRIARKKESGEGWVPHAVSAFGVAVSLGLVVVSALLNFRMGYRSADTEFDGLVYGAGAALGDGLKAISPFMAFWGFRQRDWMAVGWAMALFTALTSYSFTAALGFAAEHRAAKAALALGDIEHHQDARKEMDRVIARLDELGPQRTPGEVESAIDALMKKPVGRWTVADVSAKCTLNRISTRKACADIGALEGELARAREAVSLSRSAEILRRQLSKETAVAKSADPQVDALQRAAEVVYVAVSKDDISYVLSFLLALFIELGSGVGLYVATTPWRARGKDAGTPGNGGPGEVVALKALGEVEAYVLDQLDVDPAAEAAIGEIYLDYLVWCRVKGFSAYGRVEFGKKFAELAREAGMRHLLRNRSEVYQQVKLIGR